MIIESDIPLSSGNGDKTMNRNHRQPPRLAQWLIGHLFPDEGDFTTVGDLTEEFQLRADQSQLKAHAWLWTEIAKALPIALKAKLVMDFWIFVNHLKVTIRRLKRDRLYAIINTVGLALGLGCFLLMSYYFKYETSYDAQVPQADRIYRIMPYSTTMAKYFPSTPVLLTDAIRENIPEAELTGQSSWVFGTALFLEDQAWETRGRFADADFVKLFDLTLLAPLDEEQLSRPNTVILSQSLAHKCFGDVSPMGKTIPVQIFGQTVPMTVANVYKDITHTHLDFKILLSLPTMASIDRLRSMMKWDVGLGQVYTRVTKNSDLARIEGEILNIIQRHAGKRFIDDIDHIRLQPLREINLNPDLQSPQAKQSLYLFLTLSLIILLVAVINFVNMSMARASSRIKEIAMQKMIGAQRRELINQFLGESISFALVSTLMALITVILILPEFNRFVSRQIAIEDILNIKQMLITLTVATGVGLLTGLYPALQLSAFTPMRFFSARLSASHSSNRIKQALVITQFAVSMGLGIASVVITRQLAFMQQDWGVDRANIIEVWTPGFEEAQRLKSDLQSQPGIEHIALCSNPLTDMGSSYRPKTMTYETTTRGPQDMVIQATSVDEGFVSTFGLTLLAGDNIGGITNGVLANQCLVEKMGSSNPIGQQVIYEDKTYAIVGVVKDFHIAAFRKAIEPSLFILNPSNCLLLCLRLRPASIGETIQAIDKAYTTQFPDRELSYEFLNDSIARLYQKETRLATLVSVFSGVGIALACMGLLGLAAYMLERRTKEIGIRKALGASIPTLFVTLTKEFLGMIGLALVIATPVSWFLMRRWLQGYAYRIGISVWIFVGIGAAAVLLALVTIGVQTLKKTLANPVKALRYE